MRLDESISIDAATFTLHGAIFHSGPTPSSGHYVAVVRHGASGEPYVLYDDSTQMPVGRDVLCCDARLQTSVFHAIGLLYERAS